LSYPPLLELASEAEYRAHFEATYCRGPIRAFDGIEVRFRQRDFDHCCFESSRRDGNKDTFSLPRARRLDWIKAALQDPQSECYQGWDKKRKCYDGSRRVAVVLEDYVVVIAFKRKSGQADFVTAFLADTPTVPGRPSTVEMIRRGPKWK
jgi:hypothetical protein